MTIIDNIIIRKKNKSFFSEKLPLWFKLIIFFPLIIIIIAGLIVYEKYLDYYRMVPLYIYSLPVNDGWEVRLKLSELGYKEGTDFELRKKNEEYTINVRKKLLLKILAILASEGIPEKYGKENYSFTKENEKNNIFNKLTGYINLINEEEPLFWPTEDWKKLENYMEHSISMMEGIKNVKVMIKPPKEAIFAGEAIPPCATVLIETEEKHNLTEIQTRGIRNMFRGLGFKARDVKIAEPFI